MFRKGTRGTRGTRVFLVYIYICARAHFTPNVCNVWSFLKKVKIGGYRGYHRSGSGFRGFF